MIRIIAVLAVLASITRGVEHGNAVYIPQEHYATIRVASMAPDLVTLSRPLDSVNRVVRAPGDTLCVVYLWDAQIPRFRRLLNNGVYRANGLRSERSSVFRARRYPPVSIELPQAAVSAIER